MTQLAFCPTCGVPWGNFCPQDGTRLTGAWTCPNAPKPISMTGGAPAAAAAQASAPVAPAPVAAAPAVTPEPTPAAPAKPNRRRSPDEVKTVVEMTAVTAPPAASVDGQKGGRKRLGSALIDSIAGPSRAEAAPERERVPAQQAATSPGASAEAPAAPKKGGGGKRRQGFSETQWFMMGVQADADALETSAEPTAYEHDESIPEEQRRQFSLRRDDD